MPETDPNERHLLSRHQAYRNLQLARLMDYARLQRMIGSSPVHPAGRTPGAPITGYRAASFSITEETPWAHEVLAEHGYRYSSSVAPVAHDHYGWPEAPRFAFRPVAGSPLIEIPVTTAKIAGRRFAAGGGGFFRCPMRCRAGRSDR